MNPVPTNFRSRDCLHLMKITTLFTLGALAHGQIRIDSGLVEGTTGADPAIRVYKGIPYAAPPVGALRWAETRP